MLLLNAAAKAYWVVYISRSADDKVYLSLAAKCGRGCIAKTADLLVYPI